MWTNFINEFANPLEYNVTDNNWATAINYCHSVDNMATAPWKWHINFNLTSSQPGDLLAEYCVCVAGVDPDNPGERRQQHLSPTLPRRMRTRARRLTFGRGFTVNTASRMSRFPWSKLNVGANTITLDHEYHSDHGHCALHV
jgi:hypothetical protein